jgi:nucleoside-diphosphate-sugar epimerase|tara:strand:+ start:350 stop:1303 length:954 start_codon:yes stop_codon:yes gene_type:complete
MNKRLLIVGGTGFIGQSILDFFTKKNLFEKKVKEIIITYSNKKLIKKKKYKINNISINYIKCNLLNNFKLPKAKYIIYCALLKNLLKDPLAVKNFCKFAEKNFRKSNLLYISSGAIYGNQPRNVKKLKENYLLKNKKIDFSDKKKNLYALAKWKNEKTFLSLSDKCQKIGIARCFAFVGSRLPRKKNFAIGNFINSIINKKNIYLKAKNRVIRSYMYADDMTFWLLKIIFNLNKKPLIYNVGSNQAVDIKNLAFSLAKKYKLKLKMSYKNIPNNKFIDNYVPDISLARKELGLKLNFTNLQSIYKTIEILNMKTKKL